MAKRAFVKSVKRLVKECGAGNFSISYKKGHIEATSSTPKTKSCRKAIATVNRLQPQASRISRRHYRRREGVRGKKR